jgi:hypothetical protein
MMAARSRAFDVMAVSPCLTISEATAQCVAATLRRRGNLDSPVFARGAAPRLSYLTNLTPKHPFPL